MDKHIVMGFSIGIPLEKPLEYFQYTNPFTGVNGNKINTDVILLPSALADGIVNVQFYWALATLLILSLKCLFQ